jgi:hypothetical protein
LVCTPGKPQDYLYKGSGAGVHVERPELDSEPPDYPTNESRINLGINPIGRESLDELQAFVKTEVVRWGKVLQGAGLAGSE